MKKFSKILALALAVAMMLGMTAFAAPATTLYYDLDYAKYVDNFNSLGNAIYWDRAMKDHQGAVADLDYTASMQAFEASGLNISHNLAAANGSANSRYAGVFQNSLGHYEYRDTDNQGYMYISYRPNDPWDATNPNEIYVISADINTMNFGNFWYGFSVIGNTGTVDAPVYNRARLVTQSAYYFNEDGTPHKTNEEGEPEEELDYAAMTTERHFGERLGFTAGGPAHRLAFGLSYNAAEGKLERVAATDGVLKTSDPGNNFEIGSLKTVDAAMIYHQKNYVNHGLIRMYTIDKAAGFTAESTIGATDVDTSTKKVTVVFNQPVGAADVAVTANGKAVNGVTTNVREVIAGGKIYSEIDVNFADGLVRGKTYEIDLSGVTNELGTACANNITFATAAAPSVVISAYEGLAEGTTTLAPAQYAGKTVYVKAVATNSSSVAFDGKIVIGIYDDAGNLVRYASATKAIAGNGTATFAAAFKLAAGETINAEVQ